MRNLIVFVIMLCCAVGLLLPQHTLAADNEAIGSVVALRGPAEVIRAGQALPLKVKDQLYRQDTVKTGKRCRLQMMFLDNTLISLGAESEMVLAEYEWQPDKNKAGMKTEMKEGVFRVMGGAITKLAPQNFSTETPTATIGIRGSMYAGRCNRNELRVVFEGGKGITVTNQFGTVAIAKPGFGTRALAGMKPEPPTKFSAPDLDFLKRELGPDDKEDGTTSDKGVIGPKTSGTGGDADNGSAKIAAGSGVLQGDAGLPGDSGIQGEAGLTGVASSNQQDPTNSPDSFTRLGIDKTDSNTSPISLLPSLDPITPPSPPVRTTITPDAPTATTPIVTSTTTDNNQGSIGTIIDTIVPPEPPVLTGTLPSGQYLGLYFDPLTFDHEFREGPLSAINDNGLFTGTVTDQLGNTSIIGFSMAPYNQTVQGLLPVIDNNFVHPLSILGQTWPFGGILTYSPSGDFAYFVVPDYSFLNFHYQELGFAGTPTLATQMPTNGISWYDGYILNKFSNEPFTGLLSAETLPILVGVNWHNNQVIGVIEFRGMFAPSLGNVFFMGEVAGNQLVNVEFIGHGFDPYTNEVSAVKGFSTFGQFYGANSQGLGFTAEGLLASLTTDLSLPQTLINAIGAAHMSNDPLNMTTSPTGIANMQGFVVGLSENILDLAFERRLFMNSNPADFSLTLNRDTGDVSGSLSATDITIPGASFAPGLVNLDIGGTFGSAYLTDKAFIANIGDSSGAAIDTMGITGTVKPFGNILVTEDPAVQTDATYATWGYWQLAYQDPYNYGQYHLHEPGAFWVAGEQTPTAEVDNLINTAVVANFTGMAQGIHIDADQMVHRLPEGTFGLSVDFGQATVADAVTGNITFPVGTILNGYPGFPGMTLGVGSAASTLTNTGFTAHFTNAGIMDSAVNGAFFGPGAASIGGNFQAQFSTDRYLGIFVGDRR